MRDPDQRGLSDVSWTQFGVEERPINLISHRTLHKEREFGHVENRPRAKVDLEDVRKEMSPMT